MRVGHPPGPLSWAATSARWARGAMSRLARCGSTTAAASVPATTTLWCSRAETIWPAQVACRLHPCFLSLVSIRAWPAFLSMAGVGQAATGLPGGVVRPARAPAPARGLGGGVQTPNPVGRLVDLASQVQVEASQHRQGGRVLVRGTHGAQGVGHAPGRVGDDGRVLRVGLGAARCQVGDAAHRQPGQVAHGDARLLGHRHGQGPDGGGLVDHHQQAPVTGQLVVEGAQTRLVVRKGLVTDLPAGPGQGRGPVLTPCRRPIPMKTPGILDIHLFCRLSLLYARASRWTTGPAPTPAKDLTPSAAGRSPYQRSPAPGCRE